MIHQYAGTQQEVAGLREMAGKWHSEGFWAFDAVLESLGRMGVVLRYAASQKSPGCWRGAILYREISGSAELLYIYTDPRERGAGVGKKLMTSMLEDLRSKAPVKLALEVKPSNKAAVAFYEAFHMIPIDRRRGYYQNGEDALIYQLEII